MKRSEVNRAVQEATAHFAQHHWVLPPHPRWDVTDFGLGDFARWGLVLVNLAEEPEYCEKIMYARVGQRTPAHYHRQKKEDIIVRAGQLAVQLWHPSPETEHFEVPIDGQLTGVKQAEVVTLAAGMRVTLVPGIIHEFWPTSTAAMIGEVSTANDDGNDNFFLNEEVGRFSPIEEDEPAVVSLVSD